MTDETINPLEKLSRIAARRPDKSLGTFCIQILGFIEIGYDPEYLMEKAAKNYNGGDYLEKVEEFLEKQISYRNQGIIP